MRLHLFEFEDLDWFPQIIRSGGTDYLRYFLIRTELYAPSAELISKTMSITGNHKILDLCSGGGGCIEKLILDLEETGAKDFQICLSDKFPNTKAYELIKERNKGKIDFASQAVDVLNIPKELKGLRTMFSAIHHFKPETVKEILQKVVDSQEPICIFDGGEKGILPILGLLIIHPLAFIFCTPFFKPIKLSRFVFTYFLPLIPIYTIWDGIVSILRMYSPADFKEIVHSIQNNNYHWEYGYTKNRFGIKASYLIGYPKK